MWSVSTSCFHLISKFGVVICLGVGLLNHNLLPLLVPSGTSIIFSIPALPTPIPTHRGGEFPLLHIFSSTGYWQTWQWGPIGLMWSGPSLEFGVEPLQSLTGCEVGSRLPFSWWVSNLAPWSQMLFQSSLKTSCPRKPLLGSPLGWLPISALSLKHLNYYVSYHVLISRRKGLSLILRRPWYLKLFILRQEF